MDQASLIIRNIFSRFQTEERLCTSTMPSATLADSPVSRGIPGELLLPYICTVINNTCTRVWIRLSHWRALLAPSSRGTILDYLQGTGRKQSLSPLHSAASNMGYELLQDSPSSWQRRVFSLRGRMRRAASQQTIGRHVIVHGLVNGGQI